MKDAYIVLKPSNCTTQWNNLVRIEIKKSLFGSNYVNQDANFFRENFDRSIYSLKHIVIKQISSVADQVAELLQNGNRRVISDEIMLMT